MPLETDRTLKIMLVAGEASGDAHAAKLVNALRVEAAGRDFEFFGCAGPAMRAAGVEAVVKADDLAIIGIPEIARAIGVFLKASRDLKKAAAARRPDVVILVDFPEFNLKLAKLLKRSGLRVVYYISPQLWGWREYRKRTIRDSVDLLLAVLPFEKDWYARHGIKNVEYVGNPLANEVKPSGTREAFRLRHGLDLDAPLIALLPGSRQKELTKILPPMLEAASLIAATDPTAQFIIPLASTRKEGEVRSAIAGLERSNIQPPNRLVVVKGETYDALNAADAAAVASGTATLETGIIGTPMAIVYKTSGLNYRLVRPLINVDHFGLINLIAGKRIAAEFIQNDLTPETLAAELQRLLEPEINARVRSDLNEAAQKLGQGGASKRAAEAILRMVEIDE
ncbi:MAG: lipid-A-disaccharide synthase [Acidobacteria bacterium]|nr:lipid-A-disaccharide synthase [Acidobacteriota bacterium]